MTKEEAILNAIRKGLERFSDRLAGYTVVLFGSRARRDHGEHSDFDLGVYGSTPLPLDVFYAVGDFLDDLPTLHRIDWVDLNRASAALRESALTQSVVVYG
jgi:predicted nucleotidyltransferase